MFKVSASRWLLGIALLVLVSCTQSAAVGERFTLWEGETVRVRGTGLTIEIEQIGNQQPGSQETMDGFVFLRVMVRDEGETKVFLEVGEKEKVGEYEIRLERVIWDVDAWSCELVVTR